MLPEPLHPAVVHFPIVFVALLPLVAVTALILVNRGRGVRPTWGWVVVLAVMLSASAWVAVETGEQQEEVVEEVLASEAPMHEHEEAAEFFLFLTLGGLAVTLLGLAPGNLGGAARYAGVLCAFGLLAAGYETGHTGGDLVYEYGAAQAYQHAGAPSVADAGAHEEEADAGRGRRDRR